MDNSPNKKYLIIDADRGIGSTLALKLVKKGHDVDITGKDNDRLEKIRTEMSNEIQNREDTTKIYLCDMAKMADVKDTAAKITIEFGIKYDCVIVNSGVFSPPIPQRLPEDNEHVAFLQQTFLITVFGPFLLIQFILRNRRWTRKLHVVFILRESADWMNKYWPRPSFWKRKVDINTIFKSTKTEGVEAYFNSKAALTAIAGYIDDLKYKYTVEGKKYTSEPLSAVAVHPGWWNDDDALIVGVINRFVMKVNEVLHKIVVKEMDECAQFVINAAVEGYRTPNDESKKGRMLINSVEGWATPPLNKEERDGFIKYALGFTAQYLAECENECKEKDPYNPTDPYNFDNLAYVPPEGHRKHKA